MIPRNGPISIDGGHSASPGYLLDMLDTWRPDWHHAAARRGATDVMFSTGQVSAALALCAVCPVVGQCREAAADSIDLYGIWGNMSKRRREELRRERRAAA